VHRPMRSKDGVGLQELVTWSMERDAHEHDEAAELELLCLRGGPSANVDALRAELARREAYLASLRDTGVMGIREVREALADFRGERAPLAMRGDPTE
jgi:hypothetical protein